MNLRPEADDSASRDSAVESVSLTEDQRLYVQTIVDYFHKEARWPTHRWLRHQIGRRLTKSVRQVAGEMPLGLTNASEAWNPDHEAILTVPALRLCLGAEEELVAFLQTLQLCLARYDDPHQSAPHISYISHDDLSCLLHMDECTIGKVHPLLHGEPNIRGSGSGGAEWKYEIAEEIDRYRGVHTIDDCVTRRPLPAINYGSSGLTVDEFANSTTIGEDRVKADSLVWEKLHPAIRTAAQPIAEAGKYSTFR